MVGDLDTSVWLRERDLAYLRADGYGVWLEDGRCLRFLVHVDPGPVGDAVAERERSTAGLGGVLAGYRRTDPVVPVGVVLVIAQDAAREANLLADLVNPAVAGVGRGHHRRPAAPALAPRSGVENSGHGRHPSPVDRLVQLGCRGRTFLTAHRPANEEKTLPCERWGGVSGVFGRRH